MNETMTHSVFETYLRAFTSSSAAETERLMRSSVAEDVAFSNPGVNGRGIASLLAHAARFQDRFPGGSFRINWMREQHGQVLGEWTQLDRNGAELVTAHSYARVDEAGRIVHFAGFWDAF